MKRLTTAYRTLRLKLLDLVHGPPEQDKIHPTYGYHRFDTGYSLSKLYHYFARPLQIVRIIGALAAFLLIPVAYVVYLAGPPTWTGFGICALFILLIWYAINRLLTDIRNVSRTIGLTRDPPESLTMRSATIGRTPVSVVDDRIVVNGPLIARHRDTVPEQVYSTGYHENTNRSMAEIVKSNEPGASDAVILYFMDTIINAAAGDPEAVPHRIGEITIHELTHWACANGIDDHHDREHSERWRETIEAELAYVGTTDDPVSGDST